MKKYATEVLLCFFVLLVFLDIKVITQEFFSVAPVSREQSVSAKAPESTPTPTPFQPVWSTETQPTLTLPAPTSEIIVEPSLPENPYDFGGVLFDTAESIEIWFYPASGNPFSVSFVPVIPVNGPDDYQPGIYKSGVWADDLGNVTVNPHSGCFRYRGKSGWTELEGEFLRRHFEGGGCYDIFTDFSESGINTAVEELQSPVVLKQKEVSVELHLIGAGVITFENLGSVKSMDPTELSQLIGVSLNERSIVIITSGRDLSHDPWYSSERLIVVLE